MRDVTTMAEASPETLCPEGLHDDELHPYRENEEVVTPREEQNTALAGGQEREPLMQADDVSSEASAGEQETTTRGTSTPCCSCVCTAVVMLALLIIITIVLCLLALLYVNVACHDVTATISVTVAWNQTIPVFSQPRHGQPYPSLRASLEEVGQRVSRVHLYSSHNFSVYSESSSSTLSWDVHPALITLVYARYALEGSSFSLAFSLPPIPTNIPLYVVSTFQDYDALRHGRRPTLLHRWQLTPNNSSIQFQTRQDSYIFIVINATASMNFAVTLQQSLNLYVPPSTTHMVPTCTLTSGKACLIPLSAHSTVLGLSAASLAQAYPTVLTSASHTPQLLCGERARLALNISAGIGLVAMVTITLCALLCWYCYRRRKL